MPSAVPGVRVLTSYRRGWLPRDLVAGLVLTALLVPQRMAYAELAGLPAITGLFPGWLEWATPRFIVDSAGPVEIGVDGEA